MQTDIEHMQFLKITPSQKSDGQKNINNHKNRERAQEKKEHKKSFIVSEQPNFLHMENADII